MELATDRNFFGKKTLFLIYLNEDQPSEVRNQLAAAQANKNHYLKWLNLTFFIVNLQERIVKKL